jgi:tetratricopeptide (TPR) repeat protein
MGRYEDAVLAFTFCAGRAPQVPACFYYNRGLASVGLHRTDRAVQDFDRALELDPGLAEAALNRGILHLQNKRLIRAEGDFRRALENGADPGLVHYNFALLSLAHNDRGGALAHLEQSLKFNGRHKQARELYEMLQRKGRAGHTHPKR